MTPLRSFMISLAALAALGACAMKQGETPAAASSTQVTAVPRSFPEEKLKGMDEANLTRLLGSPGLLRHDGPAQIWQYVDEACILDLFLYREGRHHYVEHVEARPADEAGARPTVQACLDGILRDRQPLTS